MKRALELCMVAVLCLSSVFAQQTTSTANSAVVPHLIQFSGVVRDNAGKPLMNRVGVTFSLYKDEEGGAALWVETQTVVLDGAGKYVVQLGATKTAGLPLDLFTSGEARWLGVQVAGQAERPRVLLLSVPYALKAGDAETVGGLPPSAFLMAPVAGGTAVPTNTHDANNSALTPASSNVTTTGGTVNAIPLFTTASNIQNSALTQIGSGATAKVGINNAAPVVTLDVKGAETVRGTFTLPATGTASATVGKNSQSEKLVASSFNISTSTAVNQVFELRAEPSGNNTTNPSGTLNLLYGLGATAPSETGLKIDSQGRFTFASGQAFPGAGTVKSLGLTAPASDFTVSGSPVTSAGTLGLNWTVAPTNQNIPNAIVKRDASGVFSTNAAYVNYLSTYDLQAVDPNPGAVPIVGGSTASSGFGRGVEGYTDSTNGGIGVYGHSDSAGYGIGVEGFEAWESGDGVYGVLQGESATGYYGGLSGGVWGDSSGGTGVWATSDTGNALQVWNNAPYSVSAAIVNYSSRTSALALAAGGSVGSCAIDVSGNLSCSGSKSAVVSVENGRRKVALYAIEGPENWFEDLGGAQLLNGTALVQIEPTFGQTVNTGTEYRVFLTPNGDCKGLYVTNKTANSFEVRELGGGTSNISFDYRIIARRKGYENIRLADKTAQFSEVKRARRPASPKPRP